MFGSSPPRKVFSKKNAIQIRSKSTGEQPRRSQSQQSRFATSLKSHPRTDVPPRIHSTPAEHLSQGEHLWEIAPVCQKSFKRLKL